MPLEITPLNAPLGACVRGTRLKGDINPNHFQIIQQALLDHHLLLFPDQDITEAEQVGFSGLFGKLEIHPSKEHRSSVQQEIYRVSNVNEDGQIFPVDSYKAKYLTGTRIWHTDSSFRAIPSLGSLLRAAEVPPEGGETYFCNLHTAYEALPRHLKALVDTHCAVHSYDYIQTLVFGEKAHSFEQREDLVQEHPMTRSHPVTGRTALYVSPHTISEIVGLSAEESRPILEEIYEFATQNRFVYEHRWTQNDVIMWDNRCTMHSVGSYDSARYRRVMLRATVSGDSPVHR